MSDLISREWLKDAFDNLCCHNCKICRNFKIEDCSFYRCALIDNAPPVTPTVVNKNLTTERPTGEWIPITYRPMTEEEEKELCEKLGIKEGSLENWEKKVFTCRLPDDGQEILTSFGKYVQEDICSWDEYGCGLENNGDWDGVDAWMPKPEPYKKGEEE